MADELPNPSEPAPGIKPPSNDGGKPSIGREVWNRAKGVFWAAFGLKLVGEEIETHEHVVNKARVLVIVGGFCIAALFFGWNAKGFFTEKKVNGLQSQVASNSIALQIVQGLYQSNNAAIQKLNFDLVRAENERDRAKDKLAPFELRAAQLFTNELPTERLNQLYKEITEVDVFEIYLNGVELTNAVGTPYFQRIELESMKPLKLAILNRSRFALKDLTVYFILLSHGDTNIIANGWVQPGSTAPMLRGDTNRHVLWRAMADAPLSQKSTWTFPQIVFSTNAFLPFPEGSDKYAVPVVIEAHSQRSELQRFAVSIVVTGAKRR